MPDLRAAERYIAAVTRLEERAVRDVLQVWAQARADLLAVLSARPLSVEERIENLLADATRAASAAVQEQAPALARTVDAFVVAQAPGDLALGGALDLRASLRAW